MDYKIMLPQTIWQDYDPSQEELGAKLVGEQINDNVITKNYRFIALTTDDGNIDVAVKVVSPLDGSDRAVVIVEEYHREPSEELVLDLVASGYVVIIPDISGVHSTPTTFPESLYYGAYDKAGEHIEKVSPTAKDTCQYLYAIIVKRALEFVKKELNVQEIALVGLGNAVEVAMIVAGTGADVKGLACINGAGYREYIRLNKYGSEKELVLDEERMCWLTGIASVAYAKHVKAPTFIALGSNSELVDMDRVENLTALLESDTHIVISPMAGNFILPDAYLGFKIWLKSIFDDRTLPEIPKIDIRVSEEGKIYFDVDCDPSAMVNKVVVYYSTGDYNHEIRAWNKEDGICISFNNEYIASPAVYDEKAPLFAYAEVQYESGLTLTSLPEYVELKGLPVIPCAKKKIGRNAIIYQPSQEKGNFVEDCDKEVLMARGIEMFKTKRGVMGVKSKHGALKTYHFAPSVGENEEKILQIDIYTEEFTRACVTLYVDTEDGTRAYTAEDNVQDTKGLFVSYMFKKSDFKDNKLMPLTDWAEVKALSVKGEGIAISNILFI